MPSVGSITYNFTPVTKTAAYTALNGQLVLADATSAAFTVTLPASPVAGMQAAVKKTDSSANAVTVISGTAATIDGDTSAILLTKNSSGTFVFDGTNWKVVATSVFNTTTSQAVVPSGGTSGQVLAKTSSTDYATAWTTASSGGGAFPNWSAGSSTTRTFTQPVFIGNLSSAVPGSGLTSQLSFFPLQISNACTVNNVGVWNGSTNSSAGTLYLYVYADAPGGASLGPGLRLFSTTVTVSGVANTIYSTAVSWTFATPQVVWIGYGATASVTLWTVPNNVALTNMLLGPPSILTGSNPSSPSSLRYTSAYNYSTAPADATSVTTTSSSSANPLLLLSIA